MPIDPDLSAALQVRMAAPPPADLAEARKGFAVSGASLPAPEIGTVEDHVVQSGDFNIPVRIYRPDGAERPPLLIFLHGGGWMFGDLDTHDAVCRQLVVAGHCAVAAVAYRLAPEHPFPAGLYDCQAAVEWLMDHADALNLDAGHIAIGGESAGANLAAVLARKLAARDAVRPMLQLLIYPPVDFRFETPSITEVSAPGLTHESLMMVRTVYLGDEANILHPDASPSLAPDLRGLPAAIVVTVEIDPLRDEGEAYALRLAASGVETTLVRLPGLVHGFMFESAHIRIIGDAYARIGVLLQRSFGRSPVEPSAE